MFAAFEIGRSRTDVVWRGIRRHGECGAYNGDLHRQKRGCGLPHEADSFMTPGLPTMRPNFPICGVLQNFDTSGCQKLIERGCSQKNVVVLIP